MQHPSNTSNITLQLRTISILMRCLEKRVDNSEKKRCFSFFVKEVSKELKLSLN